MYTLTLGNISTTQMHAHNMCLFIQGHFCFAAEICDVTAQQLLHVEGFVVREGRRDGRFTSLIMYEPLFSFTL